MGVGRPFGGLLADGKQDQLEELGRVVYTGGYYTRGIDVSGHKQEIDWNAVAADKIDFAIIRWGRRPDRPR